MNVTKLNNGAAIKVEVVSVKTGKAQLLVLLRMDGKPDIQIKDVLKTIKDRIGDADSKVKLIDRNPVVFNLIVPNTPTFYRFTISFDKGQEAYQKGLITSIEKLGG